MNIYIIYNVLDKTWLAEANDIETENISCASVFRDKNDAQEIANDFNEQELYNNNSDDYKQFLPKPDWDFDEDGELEGHQLSGPWIVKTFRLVEQG